MKNIINSDLDSWSSDYNPVGKSWARYERQRKEKYSWLDRHPEAKAIAENLTSEMHRRKIGFQELAKQLRIDSPAKLYRFTQGAALDPHILERIKTWLASLS